jgi:thiol-disulfide isomerase/thioredoxin
MRILPALLLLSTFCFDLSAQVAKDAAAQKVVQASPATVRFQELAEVQSARARKAGRDTEARNTMMVERVGDLVEFCKDFPKSAEANKARLEIAQIARMQKDNAQIAAAAKEALAAFDPSLSTVQEVMGAASVAGQLGDDVAKNSLIDRAIKGAKTIGDHMELVTALKAGMKDDQRGDAVLAAARAAAKTDEDKATVLMGLANLARRLDNKDKAGYQAKLAEVAQQFPKTAAGKLAANKIAAANLGPGSDPVPFAAVDLDGKSVSPSDYKGKVLLIDFWATWCGPCIAELPHLLEAYEAYHEQGFDILGISLDREGDREKLVKFTEERKMPWRQVYDGKFWQAEVAVMHDVQGIPYTILIGKDGKVIATNVRGKRLIEEVKKALEAN